MNFDLDTLKLNADGLLPAIAQDFKTGEVLMLAWMNRESLQRSIETGHVTYWSRSRQEFWVKGATSGNTQRLVSMKIDCDMDCLLMQVDQTGPACHTGARSCFFQDISA